MIDRIEAVQKLQSYVASHKTEEISLAGLSGGILFFNLVLSRNIQGAGSPFTGSLYKAP